MEELIKAIDAKATELAIMLLSACLGFCIYMLNTNEKMKYRLRGGALGFFVSMAFSLPTYYFIGQNSLWALAAISAVFAISGQFLPELITSTVKKYATKKANDITGGDK